MSQLSRNSDIRIAGYAALFDRVDRGGDVIRRGAFRYALERQKNWPLLWQHRQDQQIGQIVYAAEDRRGLRIIARLAGGDDIAAKARQMLTQRAVTGLSFGYRVRSFAEVLQSSLARRELLALDLVEVSMVTHPMQPGAQIHMMTANTQTEFPQSPILKAPM